MGNTIVIPFKFDDVDPVSVESGNIKCTLLRSSCSRDGCFSIRCEPKKPNPMVLWKCAVAGTVLVVDGANRYPYHTWNASFGNGANVTHFHHNIEQLSKAMDLVSCKSSFLDFVNMHGEVHVEIVESFVVDLSDPKNSLIKYPVDAFNLTDPKHFESRKEGLWLSKKALVENLARKDLQVLTEEALCFCAHFEDHMLQFFGIIHGLNMPIDENSVGALLKLADALQCKAVLLRCVDFLREAPLSQVPLLKKLHLCEQFKLNALFMEMVPKMSIEELKTLHSALFASPPGLSQHTVRMITYGLIDGELKKLTRKFFVWFVICFGVVGLALVALTWLVLSLAH